jgi:hypothetical protein
MLIIILLNNKEFHKKKFLINFLFKGAIFIIFYFNKYYYKHLNIY